MAYSLSPGKGAALASTAGTICRVALSGLLRRAAPAAGQGPLAGEAPWPLCVSAVNSHIFFEGSIPQHRAHAPDDAGVFDRSDPTARLPAVQGRLNDGAEQEALVAQTARSLRSLPDFQLGHTLSFHYPAASAALAA